MTPLVWTRRAIEDIQTIQRFIEKDSPHSTKPARKIIDPNHHGFYPISTDR